MTPRARRALFLLLAAGLALRLALVLPWDLPTLVDGKAILVDDSFYSLGVARHLWQGHGLTADGVHPTNGFQPMFVFLAVPLYALGAALGDGDLLPIYLAQVLLAAFNALCGLWVYRLARRIATPGSSDVAAAKSDCVPLVLAGLWEAWPYAVRAGVNGLETSLAAFMVGAVLVQHLRARDDHARLPLVHLGLWLGAAFWARMDLIILALALGLDLLVRPRDLPLAVRLRRALIPASISAALFLPWLVLGQVLTGDWFPVSGRAVRQISIITSPHPWYALIRENLQVALAGLLESPFLPDWKAWHWPALGLHAGAWPSHRWAAGDMLLLDGLPLLAGLGLLYARRRRQVRDFINDHGVIPLYLLGMVLAYSLVIYGIHYFYRYLYPCLVVTLPLAAWAWGAIGPGRARRALLVAAGLVVALNIGFQARGILVDQGAPQFFRQAQGPYTEPVAGFQSGTFAYFHRGGKVINLDGVVNREAYEAIRDGRLCAYLQAEGIRSIVDFPAITRAFLWHDRPRCDDWWVESSAGGLDVVRVGRKDTPSGL
jgi:hypothetical protein